MSSNTAILVPRRTTPDAKVLTRIAQAEDGLVAVLFSLMILLPSIEVIGRTVFGRGLAGSMTLTQQGSLWIAFLGAMLAAREDRLLGFELYRLFPANIQRLMVPLRHGITAGVCVMLALAGKDLVTAEMQSTETVGWGIRSWVSQLVIPAGFSIVGLRVIVQFDTLVQAALQIIIAATCVVTSVYILDRPAVEMFGYILTLVALLSGAPIFIVLGSLSAWLFASDAVPLAAIPAETYRIVASPTLPTLALFTVTGIVLAAGGASMRLVRLFNALFGWMPGGIALATVGVCAFFTSFTGASGVTILALGSLLMPMLVETGYQRKYSLGLITGSGSIGLMFPPSLPLILFGVVAAAPINQMFAAAFIPGLIMTGFVMGYAFFAGRRSEIVLQPFNASEMVGALREAAGEILLPIIVLVGLFGGFVTLVESAALASLYAVVLTFLIKRDIPLLHTIGIARESAIMAGGVLIIVGAAFGLTSYLVDAMVPQTILEYVQEHVHSKWVFLLLLNIFLLAVGCIMDIFSAIVVVVPLLVPLANAYGIHPYHLGAIFLANLELGYLTPPVGMNLFLASYSFKEKVGVAAKSAFPYFVVIAIAVALITYVEPLSLWLPTVLFE